MAEIEIQPLPWSQLWRVNDPATRAAFLADQEELYGKCACRGPVDIYSDAAPDLCDCRTGRKLISGSAGADSVTSAGTAGVLPLPGLGLLGSVPPWAWALLAAVIVAAIVSGRDVRGSR